MHQLTGLSLGAALAIAEKFPWRRYRTVIDVGAAEGCVPVQLALRHTKLTGGGFDLPVVRPAFESCRRTGSPTGCASTRATSSPTRCPRPTCSSWATCFTTGASTRRSSYSPRPTAHYPTAGH
jgi:hypothetical protein